MSDKIKIFTDGACSGNPGPGGYGAIILSPTGRVKELGGGAAHTTNNRMELSATIEALRMLSAAKTLTTRSIDLYTDSTYVIRGITAWIFGWRKNDWQTAEGKPVTNKELWQELSSLISEHKFVIDWHYVRGHEGWAGNERCDQIAVAFSKHTEIYLYDGPNDKYQYDLTHLPSDTKLPDSKSSSSASGALGAPKGKATYLSYVHGKLYKDADWKSCEARVKGVNGAKFKKVTSSAEEAAVLAAWGVNGAK